MNNHIWNNCEWWLGDRQEKVSLIFEVDEGFEDRMIFKVFLAEISWWEKSKVLFYPEMFFNDLGDFNFGGVKIHAYVIITSY